MATVTVTGGSALAAIDLAFPAGSDSDSRAQAIAQAIDAQDGSVSATIYGSGAASSGYLIVPSG